MEYYSLCLFSLLSLTKHSTVSKHRSALCQALVGRNVSQASNKYNTVTTL